jgi:hypothetical protein
LIHVLHDTPRDHYESLLYMLDAPRAGPGKRLTSLNSL